MNGYQNIHDFIKVPFGKVNKNELRFRASYNKLQSRIKVIAYTIVEKAYYIHIQVPSERNADMTYDVVIRFFNPESTDAFHRMDLSRFNMQFFSNSPSFIYQFAALYAANGYLIELLMEKQDPVYRDRLPKKNVELNIDKSIYLACRYLLEHSMRSMTTIGLRTYRKLNINDFIQNIRSFETIKIDTDLIQLEKQFNSAFKKQELSLIKTTKRYSGYDTSHQVKAARTKHKRNIDQSRSLNIAKRAGTTKTAIRASRTTPVKKVK